MTPDQEKVLTDKLNQLGHTEFEVLPGDDNILMLHINGHLICSVDHALSLSDDDLKTLIY
jgi:hypothetical protein